LTSGDFVSALNNVNAVIGETSEALKSTAVSSQFAKANNAEMVAGLAELALKSGSWEEAVKSANVVLRVMTDMVKANNLDLSAAREIYKSLGEALKDLNPNLERVAQNQADWDLLVSNSITPLEAYETQITSLAAAAERLIAANPQDADNILKHLHEGAVQAAGDYDAALKQLTPEQEKFKASMDRVADAGANAFSQMIQGADDLGDVLTGLLRSIQDVITQMLVLEPIKASLGGFLQNVASNFSWGSIGGSSSAPASGGSAGFVGPPVPGRASGGYMEARKRYIVGEEGVELFLPKDSNLFPRLYGLKGPEQIVSPDVGGLMLSNLKTRELLEDNPEMRGQLERIHPQEEPEHRASGGIIGEGVAMLPQQRVEPLEHPLTVKVVMDRAEKAASVESKEPRTVVNVTNNSNEKAEVRRSSNGNGIDVVDVIIGTVTENIDDRGSIAKSVSRSNRLIRR
jgi:tetratricopeptide (TPR) repeat protein